MSTTSRNNGQTSFSIYEMHAFNDLDLVVFIVLDDADAVNPEKAES